MLSWCQAGTVLTRTRTCLPNLLTSSPPSASVPDPRLLLAAPQAHASVPANAIIVSRRQQGNPVLKHIRHVRWQFGDMETPDYLLGQNACALFLSLK